MSNKKNKKIYKVNQDDCISCGACIAICPNIFKFNKNSKSYVYNQPNNNEDIECADNAVNICPVKVISKEKVTDNNDTNS